MKNDASRESVVRSRYVLGFCFDIGYSLVLLIEKNRQQWQAGLLNGLGGKIEVGESPRAAMSREFIEKTSGLLDLPDFVPYGRLVSPFYEVWLFHARLLKDFTALHGLQVDGEILHAVRQWQIDHFRLVPDVDFLLSMARQHALCLQTSPVQFFEIWKQGELPTEVR